MKSFRSSSFKAQPWSSCLTISQNSFNASRSLDKRLWAPDASVIPFPASSALLAQSWKCTRSSYDGDPIPPCRMCAKKSNLFSSKTSQTRCSFRVWTSRRGSRVLILSANCSTPTWLPGYLRVPSGKKTCSPARDHSRSSVSLIFRRNDVESRKVKWS